MDMVLHCACAGGHDDVVAWLVGLGADVNAHGYDAWTPLHSVGRSSSRCLQLLLDAGADAGIASSDEGCIPLHYAFDSADCTALLINARPAGVKAIDNDGRSPLHIFAAHGTANVCLLLLDAGSFVDAMDNDGRTPLYWAFCYGKRDNGELLLDRSAQLDCVKLDIFFNAFPEWAVSFVARRHACRGSCWAVLELARRRGQVVGGNNRDVLGLLARIILDNRHAEPWQ